MLRLYFGRAGPAGGCPALGARPAAGAAAEAGARAPGQHLADQMLPYESGLPFGGCDDLFFPAARL